jgi:hypothetical protein
MAWRLARSLETLRASVNARWPNRDKTSDGTIGDAAHATRSSDHNPWIVVAGVGVVRALDIDVNGIDAAWYAEQLRLLGAAGDHRLTGGGYVIYNRRITLSNFSGWAAYTGSNPHTGHVHVSVSTNAAGFDDPAPWAFLGAAPGTGTVPPLPPTSGRPTLQMGSTGDAVKSVQRTLNRWYPTLSRLAEDGIFGAATRARVIYFQGRAGLGADGIVGPKTWAALGFK